MATLTNGHASPQEALSDPIIAQALREETKPGVSGLDASKVTLNLSANLKPIPNPSTLVFGQTFTDHMMVVNFEPESGWSTPVIQPYQPLSLDPASSCFQYCTNLFEGMKAYLGPDGEPRLFRPDLNMKRMKTSSERLALPPFDTDQLLALIRKLVSLERRWIPSLPGHSLYIRPTMIGTRPSLGVAASNHAMLYIICCPTGPYFGADSKSISLYGVYDSIRSWPGGTGAYKLGVNYAPGFEPMRRAAARGYKQVLWLLGDDHKITEAGAMNFFIVVKRADGDLDLITPPLDGTILPGVTRNSVLDLISAHPSKSPLEGLSTTQKLYTHEQTMTMENLRDFAADGTLLEAFCVGTAAIVAPVDRIGYDDKDILLPAETPVADALCKRIEAIQEGRFEYDGWSVKCE